MTRFEMIIICYLLGYITPAFVMAFGVWPFVYAGCALIVAGFAFVLHALISVALAKDELEGDL